VSSTGEASPPSARGRPRDATLEASVLRAATELLSEVGYDRLTIESIAARAGVAKTTIYRRWSDKAALIVAVIQRRTFNPPTRSEPQDLRTALLDVMSALATQLSDHDLGLLSALLTARRSDTALAEALQPVLRQDAATMSRPLERAATHSGEHLQPDFTDVLAELAPALLLHEVLLTGRAPETTRLHYLVDRIILPLITARSDAPGLQELANDQANRPSATRTPPSARPASLP
jgi:AcrR family transcriptional regulator